MKTNRKNIDNILGNLENTTKLLYQNMSAKKELNELTEQLAEFSDSFGELYEKQIIDATMINEILDILKRILTNIECDDKIMIADLLEYELKEKLETIKKNIKE